MCHVLICTDLYHLKRQAACSSSLCLSATGRVVTNALIGGYVGFCWLQSKEILDSWNESQVPREDSRLLKWAVALAGNEYRIKSTVPLRFKSAAVCVTYRCFPPCPTSASLLTLSSCCSLPSSSSFLAYFCFPLACYQPSLRPQATILISEWGCEKEEHWEMQLCFVLHSLQRLAAEQFTEEKMCRSSSLRTPTREWTLSSSFLM